MHDSVISREREQLAAIEIVRAGPAEVDAWDRFAGEAPSASFFHRYAWADVIRGSFGHEPHYLMARRGGRVCGILPLVHKRSSFFGDALISTPFLSYGGVVSDEYDVRRILERNAVELAEALSVQYLEFRDSGPRRDGDRPPPTQYVTFRKSIPESLEQIIRNIPRKGRRHDLKRSQRQGLIFEAPGRLADFYSVLGESYRDLGTPIFPKVYFERLLEAFPRETELCIVRKNGKPVSAALVFYFRDHAQPLYAGGRRAARNLHANDFLFLNIMCRARERGIGTFDFGRSKIGTGSYAYKSHWGFEAEPLNYRYKLIRGQSLPNLSPLNPRYKHLIRLWQKLPLAIANALGPQVSGHLG